MADRNEPDDPATRAAGPWRFGWPAWRAVLLRSWRQTLADNINLMSAGVAFYGFLALVPMLGAIVLCYGLLATPHSVIAEVRVLTRVMPEAAAHLIRQELLNIVTTSAGKKGLGLLLAMAIALFSLRSGAGAIITALNLAYEERETRGFLRLNLIALAVAVTAILVALSGIAAVAALVGVETLLPSAPAGLHYAEHGGGWLAIVLLGAIVAAALYAFGPDRKLRGWIWLTPGALLAATGWMLVTLGFGSYVANFGHYNATYGSLSAVVVVLTWFYLTSFVLLLGAELNCECERQAHLLAPAEPGAETSTAPDSGFADKLAKAKRERKLATKP